MLPHGSRKCSDRVNPAAVMPGRGAAETAAGAGGRSRRATRGLPLRWCLVPSSPPTRRPEPAWPCPSAGAAGRCEAVLCGEWPGTPLRRPWGQRRAEQDTAVPSPVCVAVGAGPAAVKCGRRAPWPRSSGSPKSPRRIPDTIHLRLRLGVGDTLTSLGAPRGVA